MKVDIGPYPKGKSKRKRRVTVRIHSYDIWSLDHTLAVIILPALKMMRDRKAGAPGSMFNLSHHEKFEWGSEEFKAADKKSNDDGFRRWRETLDAMVFSFEEIVADVWEEKFHTKKGFDKRGYLSHSKKIQRGFELFGKYYQALWT